MFDIFKMFLVSLKSLIVVLSKHSFSSGSNEENSVESNVLNKYEKPLNLVQPIKENETTSLEMSLDDNEDIALSAFSQEVVEVINEEEEKVA